jgi:hypothetical protein
MRAIQTLLDSFCPLTNPRPYQRERSSATAPAGASGSAVLWCFEIARVLVRFNHVAPLRRKRESLHHVSGCTISRGQLRR